MRDIASMTALGSSFAAGPGLRPVEDRFARRSARNYPHLVARALGAELVDATVSGATTGDLLASTQCVGVRRFPPQVEQVSPATDLVTVTAGGNDLNYIGGLTAASLGGWLGGIPLGGALGRSVRSRVGGPVTDEAVGRASEGLVEVVVAIRRRAPRARVLLVDYLTLLGPDSKGGRELPLSGAEIEAFAQVGRRLADAFGDAAEQTGVELVRASTLGGDHGLGSRTPWVTGFSALSLIRGPAPFHPNAAGMEAVADAILDHLGRPERQGDDRRLVGDVGAPGSAREQRW